ncbi:MAG: regulatory protein RecX [Myxococcota bacterium]
MSSERSARELALDLIGKRSLSRFELEQRLTRRGFATDEIEDALELLDSYGYIDDAGLAEAVAREAARQGKGQRWIDHTLRRRQIRAAPSMSQDQRDSAMERAKSLLLRRYGNPRTLPPKEKGKAYAYLIRRGFAPDEIRLLLDVDDRVD